MRVYIITWRYYKYVYIYSGKGLTWLAETSGFAFFSSNTYFSIEGSIWKRFQWTEGRHYNPIITQVSRFQILLALSRPTLSYWIVKMQAIPSRTLKFERVCGEGSKFSSVTFLIQAESGKKNWENPCPTIYYYLPKMLRSWRNPHPATKTNQCQNNYHQT